jgi:fatty-acyl-CoA synthase
MLHFASLFEAITDTQPDADAVIHGAERLSWRAFDEAADAVAAWFDALGLRPGAVVGLALYNGPEYLIAQYAAFKRSLVPINVSYRYLAEELVALLSDARAEVVVFHAALGDRVEAIRHRSAAVRAWLRVEDRTVRSDAAPVLGSLDWDHVVAAHLGMPRPESSRSEEEIYVLYTGGTTGLPKGVEFRMGDFVRRMFTGYLYRGWSAPASLPDVLGAIRAHTAAGERRVSVVACPLMHGTGMWLGAFYAHLMGGSVVTLPGRHFGPADLWATVERVGGDAVTIVGDAFARPMLAELDRSAEAGTPYRLDTMRIIQSSGVMFSAEVQRGLLRHLDIRIVDSMGSTEGAMARRIATRGTPIETARFDPLPGTVVVDDDLRPIPAGSGRAGRVATSATVPLGYRDDPAKSAATFVEIDGRRHSMAGDWAIPESDGTLTLLGRGSGCINTGGEKVFPEEVEEALKTHPAVVDALVVGVPDPRFGAAVAAVVSMRSGVGPIGPQELTAFVHDRLAGYKAPRTVLIVDEVRRAPNGKADYPWATEVLTAARGS